MSRTLNSAHQPTLELGGRREVVGGRWEVIEPLADGGMGRIYIAQHVRTGKRAALKVLDRDDTEAKARFQLEARISAELNHPGLVDVYDADVDEKSGRCFMAMELLEGHTLRETMDDETETPASLLALLMQVLDPLVAAHERGYVHRDLKPENIFIVGSGASARVKLLDFGIAGHELRKGLTMAGTAMGTPHYMSPEQAMDAAEALPSSDIWSMGVLLYEALSGQVPFSGDTAHAVVVRVCTEDPAPIGDVTEGVAPAMAALIMRCLSKDPEQRPKNAAELLGQLRQVSFPNSIPAQRIPQHPSLHGQPPILSSVRTRDGFHATINRSILPKPHVSLAVSLAGTIVLVFAIVGFMTGGLETAVVLTLGTAGVGLALSGLVLKPRAIRASLLEIPTTSRRSFQPKTDDGVAAPSPLVRGSEEAIVTLEVFTDLCSTAARRLTERAMDLQRTHPADIRLQLVILPSASGDAILPMGEVLEELRTRNGAPAVWHFVDELLSVRKRLTDALVLEFAQRAGVHMVSLRHALRVQMHAANVDKLRRECIQRGIVQTPTVLVQGRTLTELTPPGLTRAVEGALTEAWETRDNLAGVASTRMAVPRGTPERMELRRILVCFAGARQAPKTVRRSREQARERAEKLRVRACLPGSDFADVAMRFGDADIDLGVVELAGLPEQVVQAIAELRIGDISDLIEGHEGFSVLQRIG